MTTIIYQGKIAYGNNGEKDDLITLEDGKRTYDSTESDIAEFLAEQIQRDIEEFGAFLSVRYYFSDVALDEDALVSELIDTLEGNGEALYAVRYSETTGYLWTDNDIKIGGHDLMNELSGSIGEFLWLEITYHQTGQEKPHHPLSLVP